METAENHQYSNYNGPNNPSGDYNYGGNTTAPPYQFNVIPFQIENNLDFIDICEDGTTLLGSSNINGKYWNGSIWSFREADSAPSKDKCLTGFGLEYGVTCGKFLGASKNVIVGDEGGGVSTLKFQELSNAVHYMPHVSSYCHDQGVTSLSVSKDSLKSVSSSADTSIVVWENENLIQVQKYLPAHGREVTSVSVSKFHTELIFGSTSLDGTAVIWDKRESKPAYYIRDEVTEPLSSLDWKSDNEVAFASTFGGFYLFDLRNNQILHKEKVMNKPIGDISFNKYGLLAVCGIWNDVIVWDFESRTAIYKDTRHQGTIRSICWHPITNCLYSCGDKKTILRHDIDLTPYSK